MKYAEVVSQREFRVFLWAAWACILWWAVGAIIGLVALPLPLGIEVLGAFGLASGGIFAALFAALFLLLIARSGKELLEGAAPLVVGTAVSLWFYLTFPP